MNFTKVKELVYLNNFVNTIILPKKSNLNPYILLKKNINYVIFQGLTNEVIKDILIYHINVQNIFNAKKRISIKKINLIITKLRYSGFFDTIKAFYLLFNNKHYLLIKLRLNTVIKSITVYNSNKLKIPKKYLISILQQQIGYPKNLKLISSIIYNIKKWYNIRGYKWIQVSYKVSGYALNQIEITITEQKVSAIQTACSDLFFSPYKKNLELFIVHSLNICIGETLNFYNMEFGLIKLKTQQPIINCSYEIKPSTKNTLKVIIKYRYPKTSMSYSFQRNIYLNNQLINLIKQEKYVLFNSLLDELKRLVYKLINTDIYLCLSLISNCFNNIHINYKNLIISNFLYIKHEYNNKNFSSIQNNLKIKHYITNFNNFYYKFFINLEKDQNRASIIISYNYIRLDNIPYNDNNLLIHIFKYINKVKNNILEQILKGLQYKNIFFTNQHDTYGMIFTSVQNLKSNFSIYQKLELYKNIYVLNNLHDTNHWKEIYQFFKLVNYIIINKLYKVYEKFINYNLIICSNKSNLDNTLIPQNTWLFSLQSYTPLMINFKEFYKSNYINHLLIFQFKKIVNLSKNTLDALVNTFIFDFELKTFWQYAQYTSAGLLSNESILNSPFFNPSVEQQYFYTSLEYYIYQQYNISLFIFFTYKKPINRFWVYNLNHQIIHTENLNFIMGIGIDIHLPVYQIPIIKIKHTLSSHGKSRLYAKLYFKHKNKIK